MKVKQIKQTSREANDSMKLAKSFYHEKIMFGLDILKVGGTFEEIATAAGIKPEQTWKRLSELAAIQKIYDTGITRKLKSGRKGTVWQKYGEPCTGEVPVKPIKEVKPTQKIKNSLFSSIV